MLETNKPADEEFPEDGSQVSKLHATLALKDRKKMHPIWKIFWLIDVFEGFEGILFGILEVFEPSAWTAFLHCRMLLAHA